ncbi:DNA methyltransferase [Neomoorella thermoacetica]|uniref:Methyltransferase n=1 Tax=Moorella thermoacetica (strain ATCC 39073 / JCM 9320) TaxID=264732 RepID=Q2RK51_MOOTA|nr:DNA methyltransferase [Moorella thermoacetica]AKX93622.1 putative methyltransferase [Moorella thermoacetica]AKX96269.1 putative methyltransferase [Moorella thermoacetica]OIQ55482.1 putative methyltransferase [Moorella thermoacetica]OIQ55733.1 putative methyltransferase [Moorella thermoacetica]QDA00079.1 putative methyltransferase [Moorella thermoacetica]
MPGKLQNRLNDLDGREWLYWTDTLYITAYPPDATHPLRKKHGAMKPPEVMAEIIRFFTKKGELVLDPFAGVGGTLLGAALAGRASLGFELDPRWVDIYRTIQRDFVIAGGVFRRREETVSTGTEVDGEMRQGDCLELLRQLEGESVAAVITDPPYGINHGARGFPGETNFNMTSPRRSGDLGQAPDLESFLARLQDIGREIHRVLWPGRYLVMLVGDRYQEGEYVPLGFLVAEAMRQVGFKFKGVKIWSNKATRRPLKPYAVKSVFVPNITHQNILILRKE